MMESDNTREDPELSSRGESTQQRANVWRKWIVLVVVIVLIAAIAFFYLQKVSAPTMPPNAITAETAIGIAKVQMAKLNRGTAFHYEAEFSAGRWIVTATRVPHMVGGHVVFEISADGKVLERHQGA
ncbi:MAG: hypothetical protein LLG00_13670 [Planctomycetaceae bacterium]|nr:hypothetical protein [Planctomycetaceae bacterium]